MRAAVVTEFGPPEVIAIRDVAAPRAPGPDEARVRVLATGVNPVDAKIRQGLVPLPPERRLPYVPGREAAGVVLDAGTDCGFAPGDAVFAFFRWAAEPGGAADELVVAGSLLAPWPSEVPLVDAAAVPLAGTTAFQALRVLDAPAGSPIVVVGASGGVGTYFVQLARAAGLEVIGVASTANLDFVRALGADDVVDYRDAAAVASLAARFPDGAPFVADLVGPAASAVLAVVIGAGTTATSIAGGQAPDGRPIPRAPVEPNAEDLTHLGRLLAEGSLRSVITATFPLTQITEAHRQLDSTHTRGKVVVTVED